MCGIFGFILSKPQRLDRALEVLKLLERSQYKKLGESSPVGGHGAGVYFCDSKGNANLVKVGKTNGSPTKFLTQILKGNLETRLLMGHVRRASPRYEKTIFFDECTQPYAAQCEGLKIISVHNGDVEDFEELRAKLPSRHYFESEKKRLIDSEVLPHFLEELLLNKIDLVKALDTLSLQLEKQKGNVVSMLVLGEDKQNDGLVFLHQGSRRGLTIWSNPNGEVVFCSRKEPVKRVLSELLKNNDFEEKLSIAWKKPKDIKPMIFPLLEGVVG